MSTAALVLGGWALAVVLMFILWWVQHVKRDAGVVDVGWCAGIGLVVILYAFGADGWGPRRLVVATLGSLWAFRLAAYLLRDRVVGKEEDGRYQRLRAHWGARADLYFLVFFQSQTLLVVLFSIPFLVLLRDPMPGFRIAEGLGVLVWIVALAGETAADRTLARFRADPQHRGRTCRAGLWRWSRHPNYFFEWVHWWAYVLMGIGATYGWLTLLGPLTMLVFLLAVTGIPHTEAQALRSRPDYREYQRTTSAFIPWLPRV